MKLIVEALCGTVTEIFGAAVVLSALGGLMSFFHDFCDTFISCFLG